MQAPWRTMEIFDKRWEEVEFLAQRGPVLGGWPTGRDVDLTEAIAYHRSLPATKVQPSQLARAKAEDGIILLPMLGVSKEMERPALIIGTIGSDAHVTGQFVIARTLEDAGFNVIKLGACVTQQEFIEAAIETGAKAILVSSLYGMGFFDCEGLRDRCTEAGLSSIILYVGGHLGTEHDEWADIEARFRGIGFDRVFPPETRPPQIIDVLNVDLGVHATN